MSTQWFPRPENAPNEYPQTVNFSRNNLPLSQTRYSSTELRNLPESQDSKTGVNHGSMAKYSQWKPGQDEILMIIYQVIYQYLQQYSRDQPQGILTPENLLVSVLQGNSQDEEAYISSIAQPIIPQLHHRFYTPPERKDMFSPSSTNQPEYARLPNPGKDIVWSLGVCLFQLIVGCKIDDIRDAKPSQPLDIYMIVENILHKIQDRDRSFNNIWSENFTLLEIMLDTNRDTRPGVQEVFELVNKMVILRTRMKGENIFKKKPYLFKPIPDSQYHASVCISKPLDASQSEIRSIVEQPAEIPTTTFRQNVFECKLMMDVCSLLHNLWGYLRSDSLQKAIVAAYKQLLGLISRIQRAPEWKDQAEEQTRNKIRHIQAQTSRFDIHIRSHGCDPVYFFGALLMLKIYAQFLHLFVQSEASNHLPAELARAKINEQKMQELKKKYAQVIMILALLNKQSLDDQKLTPTDDMAMLREIIEDPVQLVERKKHILNELYFSVIYSNKLN